MKKLIAVLILGWWTLGLVLQAQTPSYIGKNTVRTNLNAGATVVVLSNANATPYLSLCVQATGTVSALCWAGSDTNNYGGYYVPAGGAALCIGLPLADVRHWNFVGVGGTANLMITREPE